MMDSPPVPPDGAADAAAAIPRSISIGTRLFVMVISPPSTRRERSARSPVAIESSAIVARAGCPMETSRRSAATRGKKDAPSDPILTGSPSRVESCSSSARRTVSPPIVPRATRASATPASTTTITAAASALRIMRRTVSGSAARGQRFHWDCAAGYSPARGTSGDGSFRPRSAPLDELIYEL